VRVLKVSIKGPPSQRVCPAADTASKKLGKSGNRPEPLLENSLLAGCLFIPNARKSAFAPCIPARGTNVPDRPECLHEIKHDGLPPDRSAEGQIPYSCGPRNGYNWSNRYPCVVEAALRHRPDSFVLDGEAVLLGVDGIADFNGLHSRKLDDEVQLYSFDVLMNAGDDLRPLPLHLRKNHLAKMLRWRVDRIILNDFERGEVGPELFRHACLMGLEGIVSKQGPAVSARSIQAPDQGEEPNVTGNEPARGGCFDEAAGVLPLRRLPLGLREPHR
jgi:bifunctional non-homologous end joining protein LigD